MSSAHEMVERLLAEGDRVGLQAAGVIVGESNGGAAAHPTTISRWCLRGIKLTDGRVVRLEHYRCGGRIITTRAAIVRFLAAQTEAPNDTPTPRTPTERRRAAARASAELEALGV
jgi:hypothetical protein